MFAYQKTNRYFAKTAPELEKLAAEELSQLGARESKPAYRGVYFTADQAALYRVNYQSRLTTRILAPLITFDCHSTDYLYKTARAIPWPEVLSADQTFAVFADVAHSAIRNSRYAALRLKDAIVDCFRDKFHSRPSIDTRHPDLWVNLYLYGNRAVISIDTAGGSLHRRGYRRQAVDSPMRETLAAAIIRLTDWDGERPFVDPMCGSGTLLAEALMSCCRIPAGYLRSRFGFERLPDYDAKLWQSVKRQADREIKKLPDGLISGSDQSERAIETARINLAAWPQGADVKLEVRRFEEIAELRDCVIVCNPPYGIRCGRETDLREFMKTYGDFLKQRCTGSTAFIYFGNPELIRALGLKPAWKIPLRNAALDGRLAKYELY